MACDWSKGIISRRPRCGKKNATHKTHTQDFFAYFLLLLPHFFTLDQFNMSTRVYLGRLARDCRDRDIEKLFRGYGDIREINLKNGFGFVEFRDNRDAEDVVYDFHGKEFLGERYYDFP